MDPESRVILRSEPTFFPANIDTFLKVAIIVYVAIFDLTFEDKMQIWQDQPHKNQCVVPLLQSTSIHFEDECSLPQRELLHSYSQISRLFKSPMCESHMMASLWNIAKLLYENTQQTEVLSHKVIGWRG